MHKFFPEKIGKRRSYSVILDGYKVRGKGTQMVLKMGMKCLLGGIILSEAKVSAIYTYVRLECTLLDRVADRLRRLERNPS